MSENNNPDETKKEIANLREEDVKLQDGKKRRGAPKKYNDEKLLWRYIHLISGDQFNDDELEDIPAVLSAKKRFWNQYREEHPPEPDKPDFQAMWGYDNNSPITGKDTLIKLAIEYGKIDLDTKDDEEIEKNRMCMAQKIYRLIESNAQKMKSTEVLATTQILSNTFLFIKLICILEFFEIMKINNIEEFNEWYADERRELDFWNKINGDTWILFNEILFQVLRPKVWNA